MQFVLVCAARGKLSKDVDGKQPELAGPWARHLKARMLPRIVGLRPAGAVPQDHDSGTLTCLACVSIIDSQCPRFLFRHCRSRTHGSDISTSSQRSGEARPLNALGDQPRNAIVRGTASLFGGRD